jgi:hypothetical protein
MVVSGDVSKVKAPSYRRKQFEDLWKGDGTAKC